MNKSKNCNHTGMRSTTVCMYCYHADVALKRELVEALKKRHSIDEQTHGLTFGYSKANCSDCDLITRAEATLL